MRPSRAGEYAAMSEAQKEKSREATRKWYRSNSKKKLTANKAWRDVNPERQKELVAARFKSYGRFAKYGLTVETYEEMLWAQAGLCAMCTEPMNPKNVCIDHNHATGQVRGLLCSKCNLGLGHIENRAKLRDAMAYLETFEAR